MVADRITSPSNPRVKAFAKLKNAQERHRTGLFLIEGRREVVRATEAGIEVETLLLCPELLHESTPKTTPGCETIELAASPMDKISLRQNPPGVIAVARQFDTTLGSLQLSSAPLILIVEGVEKPGNLGAMMRTADAVGADGVIVAGAVIDVFNPNVVRASQGSLFSVPLAVASVDKTIDWLKAEGIRAIGGYPATTTDLWSAEMSGSVAVLVGAEDLGISAAWDAVATPVRIPMAGAADSLNASVAAAILLFEAARQRLAD